MTWRDWFRRPVAPAAAPAPEPRPLKVRSDALGLAGSAAKPAPATFVLPTYAPGVLPANAPAMAMDSDGIAISTYANNALFGGGMGFVGYPVLAELTQRPEYRKMSETIAEEMTRRWIKLEATGDDDKANKLKLIEAELDRLNARDVFRRAAEYEGFFGLSKIYLDTGATDNPDELSKPLLVSKAKVGIGGLNAITLVDPSWIAPVNYNSGDALRPDFMRPQSWFVMGKQVHSSRLLSFVSREVPDLLKPAYNFGGLSLTQIAMPYVENWIRTRQSVSDLLHSFTVFILSTDMSAVLAGDAPEEFFTRLALFNRLRDNRGLMALNKDSEELSNISVPLSGLDSLQAQAQEQLSSVSSIPLVKLLGITPSGLNASSDGEIRVFYDLIAARQDRLFTKPLTKVLQLVQLSLFGEIDPEIGFRFEPLWQVSDVERAAIRKQEADTDAVYIQEGVIGPDEARARLAGEEASPYPGLDLSVMPEAPADPANEGDPANEPPQDAKASDPQASKGQRGD